MTEEKVFTLLAASVGFTAAIFLCIGSAMNSAKNIRLQATSFYGFNAHLIRALAAQRAQYVVGALLLVVSFLLQVVAVLASSTTPVVLPQWIHTSLFLVLVVSALTAVIGLILAVVIYRDTVEKALQSKKPK